MLCLIISGRSNFRSCIDTELLKKHRLLTPSDYSTEEPAPIPPPLGKMFTSCIIFLT